MAEPGRPLLGRGVVRSGQLDERVAGQFAGGTRRPEGVSAGRGCWPCRVVWIALCAEPVGRVCGPVVGRRLQVCGVRYRARVHG